MKIAVFSCSKRTKQYEQPAFKDILNEKPNFCIDLGDSYYFPQREKCYKPKRVQETKDEMDRTVKLQIQEPNYSLLKEYTYSIYDDHCFASNNSGSWLPRWVKDYSKHLKRKTFPFIPDEVDSREGLYYSAIHNGHKFIFLDVRTFREKYGRLWVFGRGFIKKKNAKLLGYKQWQWFVEEIKSFSGHIFICSGSTLTGKDGWKQYRHEYEMLKDLVRYSNNKFTFLTGDIHKNRFSYRQDFDAHEITTSGVGRDNLNNYAMLDLNSENYISVTFKGKDLHNQTHYVSLKA